MNKQQSFTQGTYTLEEMTLNSCLKCVHMVELYCVLWMPSANDLAFFKWPEDVY